MPVVAIFGAICVAGRFQPLMSTIVVLPTSLPKGKRLVTNGSSPAKMR
jgi:hypothetical protein